MSRSGMTCFLDATFSFASSNSSDTTYSWYRLLGYWELDAIKSWSKHYFGWAFKLSELPQSHVADELLTGRRGPFLYLSTKISKVPSTLGVHCHREMLNWHSWKFYPSTLFKSCQRVPEISRLVLNGNGKYSSCTFESWAEQFLVPRFHPLAMHEPTG